jgi:DNA-directed RNA polymerase specialized sigma24 family protein
MNTTYQEVTVLYERYGKMVLRRCYPLLRDEALAEDATQDVFVFFIAHRGHGRIGQHGFGEGGA